MPIKNIKIGAYSGWYQFGNSGKRYYYKNIKEKEKAHKKAIKQAIAIFASGWKGK